MSLTYSEGMGGEHACRGQRKKTSAFVSLRPTLPCSLGLSLARLLCSGGRLSPVPHQLSLVLLQDRLLDHKAPARPRLPESLTTGNPHRKLVKMSIHASSTKAVQTISVPSLKRRSLPTSFQNSSSESLMGNGISTWPQNISHKWLINNTGKNSNLPTGRQLNEMSKINVFSAGTNGHRVFLRRTHRFCSVSAENV